jgi:serine protease Do
MRRRALGPRLSMHGPRGAGKRRAGTLFAPEQATTHRRRSADMGDARHALLAKAAAAGALFLALLVTPASLAQTGAAAEVRAAADVAQVQALRRAADAVLGVLARSVEGARSAAELGSLRRGSGVVIGEDGLVLTSGYLVLEAEQVQLHTDDGRVVPARWVAFDQATGLGLVQSLVPLRIQPAPLGVAAGIADNEPLMMASGGAGGALSVARLVSRRDFAGNWEYYIDAALFTAPARPDHSGAGLFNGRGELVGVGSLLVGDARGNGLPGLPGNMFVPVDLLRPILAELRDRGSSSASARAWIGVDCAETNGEVRIVHVSHGSPAEDAGLRAGDRIERIDGSAVTSLAQLWKSLWSGGAVEREVELEVQREGRSESVVVHSVDYAQMLKRPQGI